MSDSKRCGVNKSRKSKAFKDNWHQLPAHVEMEKDPLDDDVLNLPEFVWLVSNIMEIYPGADALDELIQETYSTIYSQACMHVSCRKDISESAYAYYIAVLCYARLLRLAHLSGTFLTQEEHDFVTTVYDAKYQVPKSVGMFLAGFGNIIHQSLGEIWFKMQKPTLTPDGYFGSIKDNMYAYASYPCLGVYAQRIISDLKKFSDESSWDLPDKYRYEGHTLTKKCLGYKEAKVLTSDQRHSLLNFVSEDEFHSSFDCIPYNSGLMFAVSTCLKEIPGVHLVGVSGRARGSVGQIVTVKHTEDGSGNYVYTCPIKLHRSTGGLGGTFRYSVDKERKQFADINNFKKLLPVEFTEAQEIPDDMNINILYELSNWSKFYFKGYSDSPASHFYKLARFDIYK